MQVNKAKINTLQFAVHFCSKVFRFNLLYKLKVKKDFLGWKPGTDFGPLISRASKLRCLELIDSARKEGCRISVDGSNCSVPGFENGNFVGPTILEGVQPHMRCYKVIFPFFHFI